jgi:hypothetical protein
MIRYRRPTPGILRISAKLLETICSISALEQIDTPITLTALNAIDDDPRPVDAPRHALPHQ